MKKILITGGHGVLAIELRAQLDHKNFYAFAPGRGELDVTNATKIRKIIYAFNPDIIFHFAAKTDIDWCEKNPKESFDVHVLATQAVALAAYKIGSILVYPSTYYVYGGLKKTLIDDRTDKPNLKKLSGIYARHKLQAEQIIEKLNYKRTFTIRLGSLFGGKNLDKKFVSKILSLAKTQDHLRLVRDRYVQPSYTKDTISTLLPLVTTQKYGTYNVVGHGLASFYEYGRAVLKYANLTQIEVTPISAATFTEKAPRSMRLQVVNGKLADLNLDKMRNWRTALKEYITEMLV